MANITIGTSTTAASGIRVNNAVAFRNTSNQVLLLEMFRNVQLGPNSGHCPPGTTPSNLHSDIKYFTFNDADGLLERGPRTNAVTPYTTTGSGEQYWDDVDEICALIISGSLITYAASAAWVFNNPKKGPITFTLLASAQPTIFGDGSVSYF